MAYATLEELEVRMRTALAGADADYAEMLLDEASGYLAQLVAVDKEDAVQAANLRYACLSMVSRAMQSAQASDVASTTTSAGVYSQTVTYAAPYPTNNWWKLLRSSGYAERLGLDAGAGRVGWAPIGGGDD
ncbi:Uncharacterised protein [Slackia heliotrinireducens]|uniref:Phage protein Gp19/Gp15/Gp42 n=1 Tax=Slackia heliotrinireducens (strain ATCC 29202 / DSM 20476 / NCTC 11029 / RHS 1) TaxID=471855 RepID=C7N6N8_SLAHD|nr:hypothetical protein [Slackia heliotrinireducens]ACV22573.1 hypothetical protein Shel_15540 [Slackia heliotrinireducens DSM 20476]VEH01057.1 Uncharacterised protein [Slackia heliotrinireducens]